ncbi:Protein kinase domain [Macleaya cordata]|uniref:non-specific serine/threonine protein kinase n=1 Tax=Macleaya cordata TaxID=56857 RepID=A0A200QZY5_MACCD|nr:Protein kinase domain [Macleaya cordata]
MCPPCSPGDDQKSLPPVPNPPANPNQCMKTGHHNLKELYRLGRKLGKGQFGTTFVCVEKETGKKYACKSISKKTLTTKKDVEDVRREIQIMQYLAATARGHHPNVITIKGAYEDAKAIHLVMELCEGGQLFDRIGHYTEKKAAEIARMIVDAVETCHSLGVKHRDLKPENFMFVNRKEDSPLKMIDFGISVFFKPGETFDDLVGSPHYIAPEVVLGKPYGPKADVWSAGLIIYIMLSGGKFPFLAETVVGVFEKILYTELDFLSDHWPSVSESAKDLVKKMLVRDPKRRLTTRQVLCHPWIDCVARKP